MPTNPALLGSVYACSAHGMQTRKAPIMLPLGGGVDFLFSCSFLIWRAEYIQLASAYIGTVLCVMMTKAACRAVVFPVNGPAACWMNESYFLHAVCLPHISV